MEFNEKKLVKEYKSIHSRICNYESLTKNNEIILYFQQDEFYKREKELWKDKNLRYKLVQNRLKYINKGLGELTRKEILRGMKIAGYVKGYSHFNSQWIRKFIQEYKVKSIYDPCGGWGHRLVGLSKDYKYIYNDINTNTFNNVKKISSFLEMTNKVFYNEDSSKFYPKKYKDKIDAIFTCPPYHNTEVYTSEGAENLSYKKFLKWWDKTVKNSLKLNPRLFAFVISNKYEEDMLEICINNGLELVKKEILGRSKSHFNRNKNKNKSYECLLILI